MYCLFSQQTSLIPHEKATHNFVCWLLSFVIYVQKMCVFRKMHNKFN